MFFNFFTSSMAGLSIFMGATLTSSNYQMPNYGYGSGGVSDATSANYGLNATTGEVTNNQSTSTNYKTRSGLQNTQQSNVPTATLSNPADYYNRLKFVINPEANPSTTLFSIAISSDGFATTQYVQADNTIGPTRPISAYQSYAAWGGASGNVIVGLSPATTYSIKVNAYQGRFTESEFGPESSAATVSPSITFDIDVAATDIETVPPYSTTFTSLLPATAVTAPQRVWVDIDTNAVSGAAVYVRSANSGLKSITGNFTIGSATADLASANIGYGAQGASATQSAGGPLSISTPYGVSGQNVGVLGANAASIFQSSSPVTAGRGSFYLKARAAALTPAANDYTDTLTLTTMGSF